MEPTISVIIPTYNRAALVARAIASVLEQSRPAHEIIVVDNDSDEGVMESLRAWGTRIQVLSNRHRGLGGTRNLGISAATGRYVALLDDDDLWPTWTLETYAQAIQAARDPAMVFGPMVVFHDEAEVHSIARRPLSHTQRESVVTRPPTSGHAIPSGWCVRRSVAMTLGGFWMKPLNHEDLDFLLRAATSGTVVDIADPVCCFMRRGHTSLTSVPTRALGGVCEVTRQEYRGTYAGGPELAPSRRRLIASIVKRLFEEHGANADLSQCWWLLSRTWAWHLQRGRGRFAARLATGLIARELGAAGLGRALIERS